MEGVKFDTATPFFSRTNVHIEHVTFEKLMSTRSYIQAYFVP